MVNNTFKNPSYKDKINDISIKISEYQNGSDNASQLLTPSPQPKSPLTPPPQYYSTLKSLQDISTNILQQKAKLVSKYESQFSKLESKYSEKMENQRKNLEQQLRSEITELQQKNIEERKDHTKLIENLTRSIKQKEDHLHNANSEIQKLKNEVIMLEKVNKQHQENMINRERELIEKASDFQKGLELQLENVHEEYVSKVKSYYSRKFKESIEKKDQKLLHQQKIIEKQQKLIEDRDKVISELKMSSQDFLDEDQLDDDAETVSNVSTIIPTSPLHFPKSPEFKSRVSLADSIRAQLDSEHASRTELQSKLQTLLSSSDSIGKELAKIRSITRKPSPRHSLSSSSSTSMEQSDLDDFSNIDYSKIKLIHSNLPLTLNSSDPEETQLIYLKLPDLEKKQSIEAKLRELQSSQFLHEREIHKVNLVVEELNKLHDNLEQNISKLKREAEKLNWVLRRSKDFIATFNVIQAENQQEIEHIQAGYTFLKEDTTSKNKKEVDNMKKNSKQVLNQLYALQSNAKANVNAIVHNRDACFTRYNEVNYEIQTLVEKQRVVSEEKREMAKALFVFEKQLKEVREIIEQFHDQLENYKNQAEMNKSSSLQTSKVLL